MESGKVWSRDDLARFRLALGNVARFICRDEDAREDLIQDTFLRALQSLENRRAPPDNAVPWLVTILRNAFIDMTRRQRPDLVPLAEDPPAMTPDPEPPWGDVSIEEVAAAISQLPPVPREVFELHYIAGWRYREIAEKLDIPPNTVATRLYRARRLLRHALLAHLTSESV